MSGDAAYFELYLTGFRIEGRSWKEGERRVIDQNAVGPRFFETFGIPIIAGRDFRAEDNPSYTPTVLEDRPFGPQPEEFQGPPMVIINEHGVIHA